MFGVRLLNRDLKSALEDAALRANRADIAAVLNFTTVEVFTVRNPDDMLRTDIVGDSLDELFDARAQKTSALKQIPASVLDAQAKNGLTLRHELRRTRA